MPFILVWNSICILRLKQQICWKAGYICLLEIYQSRMLHNRQAIEIKNKRCILFDSALVVLRFLQSKFTCTVIIIFYLSRILKARCLKVIWNVWSHLCDVTAWSCEAHDGVHDGHAPWPDFLTPCSLLYQLERCHSTCPCATTLPRCRSRTPTESKISSASSVKT